MQPTIHGAHLALNLADGIPNAPSNPQDGLAILTEGRILLLRIGLGDRLEGGGEVTAYNYSRCSIPPHTRIVVMPVARGDEFRWVVVGVDYPHAEGCSCV